MPDNGSGIFSRTNGTASGNDVWAQDKAAARSVDAPPHDDHDQDMADAINARLNINGTKAMTADLDMGGNRIVNVSAITSSIVFSGTVVMNSSLTIYSPLQASSLNITGNSEFGGTCTFTGATSFGGASTFTDGVIINSPTVMTNNGALSIYDESFTLMLSVADNVTTVPSDFVMTGSVPASASSTGTAGQIAHGGGYIYICTATDTWQRVNTATWF